MSRTFRFKHIADHYKYCSRKHYIRQCESEALHWAHFYAVRIKGHYKDFEEDYWKNFNQNTSDRAWYNFHTKKNHYFSPERYFRNKGDRADRVSIRNDISNSYRNWDYEVVSHSSKKKAGYWN